VDDATLQIVSSELVKNVLGVVVKDRATALIGNAVIAESVENGLLAIESATSRITNTSILNNAGGVFIGNNASVIVEGKSIIAENRAGKGGGVYVVDHATLNLTGSSSVTRNEAEDGGGLYINDNASVHISNGAAITSNIAHELGAGLLVAGSAVVMVSAASSISHNEADDGGGLCIAGNASVHISSGAAVTSNIARVNGAGLLVAGSAVVMVRAANISGNHASNRGGGFYITDESFVSVSDGTLVSQNWGNDTEVGGGFVVKDQAKLNLTGYSRVIGNVAWFRSGGALQAYVNATVHIGEGVFFADNCAEQHGADLQAGLKVKLSIDPSANINAWSDTVDWRRQHDCLPGEVQGKLGFCERCMAPSFSLNPINSSCDDCPQHANCTVDKIRPVEGYWASSNRSVVMHKCPNADACLEEGRCNVSYTGNLCGNCAEGYAFTRPFTCGACMSNSKILAAIVMAGIFMLVLIMYTVQNTWSNNQRGALYSSNLRQPPRICAVTSIAEPPQEPTQQTFTASSAAVEGMEGRKGGAIAADLLRVLVMYVQYLVVVGNLRVEWPGILSQIYTGAAWIFAVASSQVFSLDCLLEQYSKWDAPIPIQRFLVYLAMPVLMLFAAVLVQVVIDCTKLALYSICSRRRRAAAYDLRSPDVAAQDLGLASGSGVGSGPRWPMYLWVAAKLTVLCLVVFYYFYPSLARIGFVMFSCYTLDPSHSSAAEGVPYFEYLVVNATRGYWVYDMNQPCWQGWHLTWALYLGLPCLIVFCVLVPPAMGLWLWSCRKKLHGVRFQKRFGFLYHSYNESACYWEGVVAAQTMVLVCISVFSPPLGVYYSVVLLNVAFAAIIILQQLVRPFAFRVVHAAQLFATSCLFANVNVALTSFTIDRPSSSAYKTAIGAITFVANVVFVAWCTVMIVSYGRHIVNKKVAKAVQCVKGAAVWKACTSV
jgi:hypothetical protein